MDRGEGNSLDAKVGGGGIQVGTPAVSGPDLDLELGVGSGRSSYLVADGGKIAITRPVCGRVCAPLVRDGVAGPLWACFQHGATQRVLGR